MHRYLKKAVCYLAILICVPYFVTAFLNGSGRGGSVEVDETYVRVESSESGDGSGNGADIADGDENGGGSKNRDGSGGRDVDDDSVKNSGSKEKNGNNSNLRGSKKIIEMPLEDYGIGVMAKEMPGSYRKEAWKAQAVLVRTAICKRMNHDGSDTVLEQSYLTDAQKKQLWGSNKY